MTGIIGARGFIGSYLFQHLLARSSDSLRVLVRDPTAAVNFRNAQVIHGDLRSLADCEQFASGLSIIYYLAHNNSPVNSDADQANDALLNLVPLLNLIRAIERLATKPHIVYFSSGGAVYAAKTDRRSYVETDNCAPLSSYGIQKLAAEHYLRLAAHRGLLTSIILRIGNAFGTQLPQYRMQGIIGVAVNSILQRRPVRVFGELSNVRDYIHLEDICAIAHCASAPQERFTIMNVGTGIGHSVTDVLRLIEECHGGRIEIQEENPFGQWLPDWVVLDAAKARQVFGWFPVIDLRSGIEGMLTGRYQEVGHDAAIA